jgi:hypothetical protein
MTSMAIAVTNVAAGGPMPTGGRWGWYRDHEGNEWRRVSKLIKKVETDNYNLEQWYKRQVGEGLAIRDDLVLAIKAMGRPDPIEGWSSADKKKLDGIMREASDAAKQRNGARTGTAMHDLTERLDRGEDIESVVRGLPAGPAQSLRAYAFLRRANGWRTVLIEHTVVNDEVSAGGTFDRIEEVPGLSALLGPGACQYGDACPEVGLPGHGDTVIMDVKTETAPWLNGLHIGPQTAIYSRARRMWRATGGTVKVTFSESEGPVDFPAGEYVRMPCVRQDVSIVVHVLDGAANPYFVNLTEGWEAALAAAAQQDRETRAKRKLGAAGAWFVEMPGVKRPAPAQMLTEQAVAADYGNPNRPAAGGAEVAVEIAPGVVSWQAEPVPAGQLDTVDKQAIETIWSTTDVAGLAKVWEIYTSTIGRAWGGRVAEAADARRRQVECPQRALHTSGTCACGWTGGFGIPA